MARRSTPGTGTTMPYGARPGERTTPGTAHAPGATGAVRRGAGRKPARAKQSMAVRRKRFLALLADSGNVSRAARGAGISTSALYRYRTGNAGFAKLWDDAIDVAMDELENALLERARDGVERPVYFAGKKVGAVRTYSDALGMFLLKAKRPDVYNRLKPPTDEVEAASDDPRAAVLQRLDRLAEGSPASEEDAS